MNELASPLVDGISPKNNRHQSPSYDVIMDEDVKHTVTLEGRELASPILVTMECDQRDMIERFRIDPEYNDDDDDEKEMSLSPIESIPANYKAILEWLHTHISSLYNKMNNKKNTDRSAGGSKTPPGCSYSKTNRATKLLIAACALWAAISGLILNMELATYNREDVSFLEPQSKGIARNESNPMGLVQAHTFGLLDSMPMSAWIQDISNPISCGKHKCAFRSKNSPDVYGYITTQSVNDIEMHAYKLAQNLATKFGIRVLDAAPPRSIPCTTPLAINLAANLTNSDKVKKEGKRSKKLFQKSLRDYWNCEAIPESNLYLQPIMLAPRDAFEFKPKDVKKALKVLEKFATESITRAMTKEELSQFKKQLASDSKTLNQMVLHTACLSIDFQVLIDLWTGKIYHMDFDRCWLETDYPSVYMEKRSMISEGLNKFTKRLIEYHRKPPILNNSTDIIRIKKPRNVKRVVVEKQDAMEAVAVSSVLHPNQ